MLNVSGDALAKLNYNYTINFPELLPEGMGLWINYKPSIAYGITFPDENYHVNSSVKILESFENSALLYGVVGIAFSQKLGEAIFSNRWDFLCLSVTSFFRWSSFFQEIKEYFFLSR